MTGRETVTTGPILSRHCLHGLEYSDYKTTEYYSSFMSHSESTGRYSDIEIAKERIFP